MTEASASNYWISSTALSITLNAMGDADYIQANVASGAMIMCYMRNIDGLGYDAGHNYRRWNLIANPTYFNSTTEKYVYAAIPRKQQENGTALIVFPSERVDIYGKSATEVQLGSEDYYYIFLGGVISPSVVGGVLQNRTWTQRVDTGKLASDEAIAAGGDNTWWIYNAVDDTVTFWKTIVRAAFDNIEAKYATVKNLILGGETLTGVANDETPKNSRVDVVTPDYLFGNSDARYVRKDIDDRVSSILTFLNGVEFGVSGSGITGDGNANLYDVVAESLKNRGFRSGLIDGSGFGIYYDLYGKSIAEVDKLNVRQKATFSELEYKRFAFTTGDVGFTSAGAHISDVIPIDNTGAPIAKNTTVPNGKTINAYRCYFLADDGDKCISNDWRVGDQAMCKTANLISRTTSGAANRYYWRLVVNKGTETINGKKYHFIDLSNVRGTVNISDATLQRGYICVGYDTNPSVENDVPMAEDDLIQLGSQTDTDRQGAVVIYVSENSKIVMYAGINDYNLTSHIVNEFSPNGSTVRSDKFSIISGAGMGISAPIVCDRGQWVSGTIAGHYDRFSYNGSLWLCNVGIGQTTNEAPSETSTKWIKQVSEGEAYTISVVIKSGLISNGKGSVTLQAMLYKGNVDVSSEYNNRSLWSWKRNSGDAVSDRTWNGAHQGVGREITITASEVTSTATFDCEINN